MFVRANPPFSLIMGARKSRQSADTKRYLRVFRQKSKGDNALNSTHDRDHLTTGRVCDSTAWVYLEAVQRKNQTTLK